MAGPLSPHPCDAVTTTMLPLLGPVGRNVLGGHHTQPWRHHAAATVDEAQSLVTDLTGGQLAGVCVVTTDNAEGAQPQPARADPLRSRI